MYDINKLMKIEESKIKDISLYLSSLSSQLKNGYYTFPYAAAYTSLLYIKNNMVDIDELEKYVENNLSETRRLFIEENLMRDYRFVSDFSARFSELELAAFILRFEGYGGLKSGEFRTPESVSKLALRILQIKDNETVADFGSGIGCFLCQALMENRQAKLYGVDLNTTSIELSKIITEIISENIELEQRDMFELENDRTFDKIFSNYPFGLRLKEFHSAVDYLERINSENQKIRNVTSSDWLFNLLLINCLSDKGKAVGIMTNGSTWNSIDKNVRQYFISKGYIEAVIMLPAKLFDYTVIGTTMIVLSKGNKSIRMVDASDICEIGRRQNLLSDKNIDDIYRLLSEDGERSIRVENEKFKEIEYVLNPMRFLEKKIEIKNGVEFGTIIKRITRGAQIKADDLDEMISDTPTNNQYLMLTNIQNGMISEELPYLKELDERLNRYLIKDKNLLLSKNGAPFKVAVADVEENQKLLGNGNLFIIELDLKKANPYFIKAFFESETGALSLKSISVGSTIPNISTESLRKLTVPLPPIEEQNEFEKKYLAKIDEIKILQTRLKKAMSSLKNMFEEG